MKSLGDYINRDKMHKPCHGTLNTFQGNCIDGLEDSLECRLGAIFYTHGSLEDKQERHAATLRQSTKGRLRTFIGK